MYSLALQTEELEVYDTFLGLRELNSWDFSSHLCHVIKMEKGLEIINHILEKCDKSQAEIIGTQTEDVGMTPFGKN